MTTPNLAVVRTRHEPPCSAVQDVAARRTLLR